MNFAGVKSITIPEGDVKSIAIGGVTVWQKPNPLPYDAEAEYVASTGAASYVNTGISPVAATFGVDIVFSPTGGSCPQRPFGCRSSSISAGRGSYNVLYVTDWSCRVDMIGTSTWSVSTPSGSINRLTATPSGVSFNGEYRGNVSDGKIDCPYPFYLFAINNAGSLFSSNKGTLAIYSCKIYESNSLVRDFVPVRVGTVGYLYDRANPTGGPSGNGLYGSATSTPLVAGPDKNGGAA